MPEIESIVHTLVKRSVDSVSEMEAKLARCVEFIKEVANTKYDEYAPPERSAYCNHIEEARELLREFQENE